MFAMVFRRIKYLFVVLIVALNLSCRTEIFYENYNESGYKEDGFTRAEFREDFWTCKKHKKRLHKTIIPIRYGLGAGGIIVPDSIPNANAWPHGGGCVVRLNSPRFIAVSQCAKCQQEYRKYKRAIKKQTKGI